MHGRVSAINFFGKISVNRFFLALEVNVKVNYEHHNGQLQSLSMLFATYFEHQLDFQSQNCQNTNFVHL